MATGLSVACRAITRRGLQVRIYDPAKHGPRVNPARRLKRAALQRFRLSGKQFRKAVRAEKRAKQTADAPPSA